VFTELTFVCVTVNTPLTGPVSFPSVVLAIDTVALSLSVMFAVAERFAGVPLNATLVLPLAIDVSVAITVSVGSTMLSSCVGIEIVAVIWPARIVTVCGATVV